MLGLTAECVCVQIMCCANNTKRVCPLDITRDSESRLAMLGLCRTTSGKKKFENNYDVYNLKLGYV